MCTAADPGIGSRPGYLYGGVSGVELPMESFSLGDGVEIRPAFSHMFSINMLAFAPPTSDGFHPAPWKSAKGGFGYDIAVEICVPPKTGRGEPLDARETIWWIAALLRIARFPNLTVPVISDCSFRDIPQLDREPTLTPFEVEERIFAAHKSTTPILDDDSLRWVSDKWRPVGRPLETNAKFYSALKAFDGASIRGRASASMLALWGGLEQLFSPSAGELRFRVSALLAAYLVAPGAARRDLYRKILKLYNERSLAAHTAKEVESGPIVESYVIMRNALVRMIDEGRVPTQHELEDLLFGGSDS